MGWWKDISAVQEVTLTPYITPPAVWISRNVTVAVLLLFPRESVLFLYLLAKRNYILFHGLF